MAETAQQAAPLDLHAALMVEQQERTMLKGHAMNLQKQVIMAAQEVERLKAALDDRDRGHSEIIAIKDAELARLLAANREMSERLHAPESAS